jgi:hypothetical protein
MDMSGEINTSIKTRKLVSFSQNLTRVEVTVKAYDTGALFN